MVKIAICGVCGKMGSRIFNIALQDKDVEIVGLTEVKNHVNIGKKLENKYEITDNLTKFINKIDVVIDFTTTESTLENLNIVNNNRKSIVIGTTGFNDNEIKLIKDYSKNIAIVLSPNMSIGVNILFKLVDEITKIVPDYDIEIIESHHNQKKDAPSGTAKKIAEIIANRLNLDLKQSVSYGRTGLIGPRKNNEIGIHSIRGGDIVGEHTVIFTTTGERLELIHRAHSRDTFATGAIKAAKWVYNKKPGLYDMLDVLGLK